jgi:hypothetical protein
MTDTTSQEPEIHVGTREQLLHLLAEAAEIEHTLMCSYLYAAFSLRGRGEEGITDAQGEALVRWRRGIIDVAVQEMGHLVIVANLTVAVGGRPHFARPNFPVSPGYFPSGVAVRLAPFDEDTLEHFIFLERPQNAERTDAEGFEQTDYAREQAHDGLMPTAQDYDTIGHLYEAIRANLGALNERIGKHGLFLGDEGAQIGRDIIDLEGVDPITDLDAAMAAINIVIKQGEGSAIEQEYSHYRCFLTIQDELIRLKREDPGFRPAWPVADSPVLRRPVESNGACFVDHPEAARLLDFACAAYGLLLRCLTQCFGRTGSEREAQQKALMSAALDLMHVVGDASSQLARLPARTGERAPNAGMSFTMLRGVEPLLGGEPERCLLRERAGDLIRSAAMVLPGSTDKLQSVLSALEKL